MSSLDFYSIVFLSETLGQLSFYYLCAYLEALKTNLAATSFRTYNLPL